MKELFLEQNLNKIICNYHSLALILQLIFNSHHVKKITILCSFLYIKELDKKLLLPKKQASLGLAYGKMGFCLYFYYISRLEQSRVYRKTAEQLLSEIYEEVHQIHSIELKHGLSGIGLGIRYLLREGYVKGNVNTVLKDIDDVIFKTITSKDFYEQISTLDLMHILYYLSERITDQQKGSEVEWFYQELIISIISELRKKIDNTFFEEPINYSVEYKLPLFLLILSKIHSLGYYNYCIEKIAEEVSYYLCVTIPHLHAHRLSLLVTMYLYQMEGGTKGLDAHIKLLSDQLDISRIFDLELKDKNLFFNDGLVSIYVFLHKLDEYTGQHNLMKYTQTIQNKINFSEMWNLWIKEPTYWDAYNGLYHGYCGVALLSRLLKE